MNKKLEHVIHMSIARFIQENFHSSNIIFRYLTLDDKDMNESVNS